MINYRAIHGKLVRAHVIGCHARCFWGRDRNSYKIFSASVSKKLPPIYSRPNMADFCGQSWRQVLFKMRLKNNINIIT